ncbi:UDP-glucuronic acid decarboxylase 1 [Gossypium arboreum]|uniref:UDP-glucuronate decarboxylase n=1 Tax=Gossypium arboreum TaxID=29729 RepID=A0A0B0P785_GOSAR|nr:UDP-glucuronic acid decarboxylase 1 [Gossypium arboreum]
MGTLNMLGLAKRVGARFLLTSTSEVYGDPLQHPQKETYWGNVNPIGERSCYDEGKRTAETLTMDYHRGDGVEIHKSAIVLRKEIKQVRIARIFNTYGPRMCLDDGRVVSNFVAQAIRKQPMTVYGDGKQTRSFQYVSDLVDGLVALMEGEHIGPFNLGNPGEFTMLELAEVVKDTIDPSATIEYKPNTADDPHMRKPDISKAKELLNWEPKIPLREGLPLMVNDFRNRILNEDEGKGA